MDGERRGAGRGLWGIAIVALAARGTVACSALSGLDELEIGSGAGAGSGTSSSSAGGFRCCADSAPRP